MPLRLETPVVIGEIVGDYMHRRDLGERLVHTQPVRWFEGATAIGDLTDPDKKSAAGLAVTDDGPQLGLYKAERKPIIAKP